MQKYDSDFKVEESTEFFMLDSSYLKFLAGVLRKSGFFNKILLKIITFYIIQNCYFKIPPRDTLANLRCKLTYQHMREEGEGWNTPSALQGHHALKGNYHISK